MINLLRHYTAAVTPMLYLFDDLRPGSPKRNKYWPPSKLPRKLKKDLYGIRRSRRRMLKEV